MNVKRIITGSLNKFGFEISRRMRPKLAEWQLFESLLNVRRSSSDTIQFLKYCAQNMDNAHAQLFQDLLVLFLLDEKRDGYFVECGAMDGIKFSNTFLLENKFGWRGIIAEPARCWHRTLSLNRSCLVDHRCVWSKSGETLQFNETPEAEYSTIDALSGLDSHTKRRRDGKRYAVKTISLCDLLLAHDAPISIDYLSIDTEGSEFAILDNFFPCHYEIGVITVEHNNTSQRYQIYNLLTSRGYNQVFRELSMWDDWYIKQ
jgi:FkbM family methyltransferase